MLEISINPPNGRSNSRIMYRAPTVDNKQTSKTVMTVAFGGEIMPKQKKMITSQNTMITKNGIGNELCPCCAVSSQRTSAISPLIRKAWDNSQRWVSFCGDSFKSLSWMVSSRALGLRAFISVCCDPFFGQSWSIVEATPRRSKSRASFVSGP